MDLELIALLIETHQNVLKEKEDQITQLTEDVELAKQQSDELVEEADRATTIYESDNE